MLGTTLGVFDIQIVRAIQSSNGALTITLANGLVARLPPDDADRDRMLRAAEDSLREDSPVGVLLGGEERVLELSPARETAVASIREDEDRSRLAVWFWEYSPVCYLTRDHPEFDRIRALLEQSVASGSRIWLANRMHLVESETEVWWQILDVRPVETDSPAA
jgi:hypothetical protein